MWGTCSCFARLTFVVVVFVLSTTGIVSAQDEARVRIARPVEHSNQDFESGKDGKGRFHALNEGVSGRWWRKFRNPSFCPYVLCAGSCSDISGETRVAGYSHEELLSDTTPCSLTSQSSTCASGSCCTNKPVQSTSSGSCMGDGACVLGRDAESGAVRHPSKE